MASTQDSLLDMLADVPTVTEEHAPEPTNPIQRARDRIAETLDYLVKTGAAPKRAQMVAMLDELRNDLDRELRTT